MRRFIKTTHMLFQLEHTPFVRPDTFKCSVAVKEPVIEDGHLRVFTGNEFTIDINFHACLTFLGQLNGRPACEWSDGSSGRSLYHA